MFIDYLATMLINLAAGLGLLAFFVFFDLDDPIRGKRWAPAFAVVGLTAFIMGLHMSFAWPLPGSYNIAFGGPSILFGALYLGTALSLSLGWDLVGVAIYGLAGGVAAVFVGAGLWTHGMTSSPGLATSAFLLTGLAGIVATPVWWMRHNRVIRLIAALILAAAGVLFAITGYGAYYEHLSSFSGYSPPTMGQ